MFDYISLSTKYHVGLIVIYNLPFLFYIVLKPLLFGIKLFRHFGKCRVCPLFGPVSFDKFKGFARGKKGKTLLWCALFPSC